MDGFDEVVSSAWAPPLDNIDACRVLNAKLRQTTKALKAWSARNVGSMRQQLFMTCEIIAQLDATQETRELTNEEFAMRVELKPTALGWHPWLILLHVIAQESDT